MKKYAVIVAGGSGTRMGAPIPKQFLLLNGKTILFYSVKAFLDAYEDIEIVLVLPKEYVDKESTLPDNIRCDHRIKIVPGGETRFQSVKNGLRLISDYSIVFVHDAVRCLVSKELIQNCYAHAVKNGNAVPAVAATDSIRIEKNGVNWVEDRTHIRIIQTPQTFKSDLLLPSFLQDYQPFFTDEATVVETAGTKIYLIEGEYQNLKITRPADLFIAEKILEERALLK